MKYFDKNKCIEEINKWLSRVAVSHSPFIRKIDIINIINSNIKSKTKSAKEYKNDDTGKYDFPLGTKFIHEKVKYEVIEKEECIECEFCEFDKKCYKFHCGSLFRKDQTSVIFKEIK